MTQKQQTIQILNTSVIKAFKVDFTIKKSNEIETDLSNNTKNKSKIGEKTRNQTKQRHSNSKISHNFGR